MKKMNQKGFTLAELLIVVAIIAVLVAVAIPVFNNELEKSREAADVGNLRTAYAVANVYLLAHPENTATELYFNPSAPESISTTKDDDGAKIGRKASVNNQQSGDAKINFNTDYTFGPTTGDLGGGKNLANSDAVIKITVNKNDNSISLVSFDDDAAPLSIVWKEDKPDTLKTKAGATAFDEDYDLAEQFDIKVYGTAYNDENEDDLFDTPPAYTEAVNTGNSSLTYYGLQIETDETEITIKDATNDGVTNSTDGGVVTYIPIKLTAKLVGDNDDTVKIFYIPIQIAPKD